MSEKQGDYINGMTVVTRWRYIRQGSSVLLKSILSVFCHKHLFTEIYLYTLPWFRQNVNNVLYINHANGKKINLRLCKESVVCDK